jgi:hypothetical protein
MRRTLLLAAVCLFITLPALADLKVPRESPPATERLGIGISTVEVVYHRPAVKGRKIWGGLVPYGEVWRLGANNATTISFSDPAKVAGREVPAGTYGLFAIPGEGSWTVILNKQPEQWGAYFYKAEDDLLRFEVKPQAAAATEWMTLRLDPVDRNRVDVGFAWDELRFSFPVEIDVDRVVWAHYDAGLADPKADWAAWQTAAHYAQERGQRLDEAMVWIDKSIALQESFWNLETKARLLYRAGKTAEALPLLDKAAALAQGKAPQAYVDGLKKTRGEWTGKDSAIR